MKQHINSKTSSKSHLPQKNCLHCKREFSWRKKRARCREEVKFCSEQCKSLYKKIL